MTNVTLTSTPSGFICHPWATCYNKPNNQISISNHHEDIIMNGDSKWGI